MRRTPRQPGFELLGRFVRNVLTGLVCLPVNLDDPRGGLIRNPVRDKQVPNIVHFAVPRFGSIAWFFFWIALP